MECKSQWRLLAASIAVDVVLRFFFGVDVPQIHLLLAASSVVLAFCALSIHLVEWLKELLHAVSGLGGDIHHLAADRQRFMQSLVAEILFYAYLAYQLIVRMRNFRNMADDPCICGVARPDGSRPSLREHCWRRRRLRITS
jgi:hypothetical protein